jgi:hypothetical protein
VLEVGFTVRVDVATTPGGGVIGPGRFVFTFVGAAPTQEVESATAELNPFTDKTLIVDVPLLPFTIESAVGPEDIEKSGVTAIVNERLCERVKLPLVPVISIVEADADVPASTLTVAVEVAVPPEGGVTELGEKFTCTRLGKGPVKRLTAELNEPIEVIVTVSVAEPPGPTVRLLELNEIEKSLSGVIVSVNVVVRVSPAFMPLTVIATDPVGEPEATVIPKVAEPGPPAGIVNGLGLKLENVTPVGIDPVTESVTGPEKDRIDVPVIATVPEPPCGIEIVPGDATRPKSGVESVSFAILFVPASNIQSFPELSAITSCGVLPGKVHSVNWLVVDPIFALVDGATTFVATATGPVVDVTRAPNTGVNGVVVDKADVTEPPAEGSSTPILLEPCSATHGLCDNGLMLMTLRSAPAVGTCHSLNVLSPRKTPT